MDLYWKPVMRAVRRAQAQLALPISDDPIDGFLSKRFGIDVADPRQLNYLIQCISLQTPVLAEAAMQAYTNDFFGLDQTQSGILAFMVLQSSATLILKLRQHLPPQVLSGRVKRERVYLPPIEPATFNWSTITPNPAQVEQYEMWERVVAARSTPGIIAARDQAEAMLRDASTDALFAYMNMVARMCVVLLATSGLDPDEVPTEGAERFSDVVIVTMYQNMPEQYRLRATGD